MKIAIVGSRKFPNPELVQHWVREYVRALPAGTVIVSGGASGADTWAEQAAREFGLETEIFEADWEKYAPPPGSKKKNPAGMIRNKDIVRACDRLVAFQHQRSKGTQDSREFAIKLGKVVDTFYSSGKATRLYPSTISSYTADFEFLSSRYPAPLTIDSLTCPTLEHAYYALSVGSAQDRKRIIAASDPDEARLIAEQSQGRAGFEVVQAAVLERLVEYKFAHYPQLRVMLRNTGGALLAEVGEGLTAQWNQALVNVRSRLRQGEKLRDEDPACGAILYVDGDLFKFLEHPGSVLTVPCNTEGTMGAGLALEFKTRWPEIEATYQNALGLGLLSIDRPLIVSTQSGILILFLTTKTKWSKPSKIEFMIAALQFMGEQTVLPTGVPLAMPEIGCGLGGLDWKTVQPFVERYLSQSQNPIYVHSFRSKAMKV